MYHYYLVPVYIYCFRTHSVYLSFRHGVLIPYTPCHRCPLAVSRSCFGIRLALADGSGLPFSLYPPLAALESQTPQREARALPRRTRNLQKCVPQLSPPQAGCPHPSCCGAAPQRATFPVRGRSSAAGGSLRFAAVALSFQNVPARRAHIHFSCARRARFMCRRHASCAEGALHLRSKKIPPFDKSKDGNKSRGTTFVGNAQSSSCPVTAASRPILLAPGRFPSAAWE